MVACWAEACSLAGLCLSVWAVLPAFAVAGPDAAVVQFVRVTALFRQAAWSLFVPVWFSVESWAVDSLAKYTSGAWYSLYCDPESVGQDWPVAAGCSAARWTCHTFHGRGSGSFLCCGRADRPLCFAVRRQVHVPFRAPLLLPDAGL